MSVIKNMGVPDSGLSAAALVRLRVAVTLFFALGGFLFAGWAVRIPALKQQVDASPGSLGLALLCLTGSAVLTMAVTGRLCERFGSRQVTIVAAVLLSVAVVPPTLTDSALALGLTLIAFGVAFGGIDVAVNSLAVDLIAVLRRPVMPSFHAANSFGSLAGAALGGLLAAQLSPAQHMLLMVPAGLAASAVGARMLLAYPLPGAGAATERAPGSAPRRGLWGTVLFFGLIGLCAAYCQGALDNWVPLHIKEDLGSGETLAATGYALVQLTMGLMRLSGIALVERLGATRVTVFGGVIACAGGLTAALAPSVPLVFAGLVATGVGLANIFPIAMAQAGAAGGPGGIALAATLGYCGILAAPPSIGLLADVVGLPSALTLIPLSAAVAAAIAYAIRPRAERLPLRT
ncbi:MFS transporter [Sphaerisporangium sp. TRM90804]|uniref:MFS transporter n=1 Tax=Sphaerisporangium sp. TRM90804 TaxID=3031113 RepID=UPI002448CFB7|nr:MFS transporter [Sphaerisporangium sp. TRM90804]MDH2426551.1 MFS transporter [Sphaerisporangium sp. TRM90804]